jgi:hypothetical protein
MSPQYKKFQPKFQSSSTNFNFSLLTITSTPPKVSTLLRHSPPRSAKHNHGHPKRPVVRSFEESNCCFFAIKSFTSQFDHMNFPFRNAASGLTAQTMKFSLNSTINITISIAHSYQHEGKHSLSSNGITNPTSLPF